jgi:hypothetical protein
MHGLVRGAERGRIDIARSASLAVQPSRVQMRLGEPAEPRQLHERLVPDPVRIAGDGSKMMESDNSGRGNLCAGVVGQAAEGSTIASQTRR